MNLDTQLPFRHLPSVLPILYLCSMRFLVPLSLASTLALAAQSPAPTPTPSPEPVSISAQETLAHRIGHDRPAYPRFALAAGVEGVVKVQVTITLDGHVQTQTIVSGPPALIPAAQAWIAASSFRPFLRGGQPVAVTATVPVVYQLPAGSHSAHPLPAVYERNITTTIDREGRDNPPRVRLSALSPAVRQWLARYEASIQDGTVQTLNLPLDQILARESDAIALVQTPGNVAIYQIPLTLPRHHLYLLFEFSKRFGKSNCALVVFEETPTEVRTLLNKDGIEVDLHRRHDSPYPDILIWTDSGQPGISNIAGYSYYGGQWGQLYCGTDDAYEDSERDEQVAEHRGVRVSHPPLVTLCK